MREFQALVAPSRISYTDGRQALDKARIRYVSSSDNPLPRRLKKAILGAAGGLVALGAVLGGSAARQGEPVNDSNTIPPTGEAFGPVGEREYLPVASPKVEGRLDDLSQKKDPSLKAVESKSPMEQQNVVMTSADTDFTYTLEAGGSRSGSLKK